VRAPNSGEGQSRQGVICPSLSASTQARVELVEQLARGGHRDAQVYPPPTEWPTNKRASPPLAGLRYGWARLPLVLAIAGDSGVSDNSRILAWEGAMVVGGMNHQPIIESGGMTFRRSCNRCQLRSTRRSSLVPQVIRAAAGQISSCELAWVPGSPIRPRRDPGCNRAQTLCARRYWALYAPAC